MEKRWKELLKRFGQGKKNQWLILALCGILLLVIAIPVPEQKTAVKEESTQKAETVPSDEVEELEQKLAKTLSQVSGVGEVRVMITIKSNGEKIVEKDRPVTERITTEEGDGNKSSSSERTAEESTVYIQDGEGGETPYVVEELEPQIQGVIVVAEGGGDPKIAKNITEAVEALFGVETHKIKVMKKN